MSSTDTPHTPPHQLPKASRSTSQHPRPISPPLTITPSPPRALSSSADLLDDSAQDIVRLFRQYRYATSTADNVVKIGLERPALIAALDYLRDYEPATWQHVQERTRWEYNAATKQLRLRMVSSFHENICEEIERKIQKHVRKAIQNSALPTDDRERALEWFDTGIKRTGSADVQHGIFVDGQVLAEGGKDSPDKSWTFSNARTPVFVLEFAWSQNLKDLKQKSARYVEDKTTDVRTVVGISSEYSAVDTSVPQTHILRYRRYFRNGEYGVLKWGPRDISREWVMAIRLTDFVPWNVLVQQPHFQTWSDTVGDIIFPSRLFRELVENANDLRIPPALATAPDDIFSTATLGKHERDDSEQPSSPSEATDSLYPTTSPDQSFESTNMDPSYSSSAVVGATSTDLPPVGISTGALRAKRTKTVE
ncbi:hypothetical protein BST61_g11499 [Cercospora zeina]